VKHPSLEPSPGSRGKTKVGKVCQLVPRGGAKRTISRHPKSQDKDGLVRLNPGGIEYISLTPTQNQKVGGGRTENKFPGTNDHPNFLGFCWARETPQLEKDLQMSAGCPKGDYRGPKGGKRTTRRKSYQNLGERERKFTNHTRG